MDMIKKITDANQALEKATGTYGRFDEAVKYIDPAKNRGKGFNPWLNLKDMNVIDQIMVVLKDNGIASLEEAKRICDDQGIDVSGAYRGKVFNRFALKMLAGLIRQALPGNQKRLYKSC